MHSSPRPRGRRVSLACLFTLFTALATGCATAPKMFGDRARYSPAFEGYVIAKTDGSDDPAKDARVLLLRDPVTGNKLRCREDVVEWRELYEDVATDRATDSNAAVAAGITGGALLGPLVVVEPIGSLAMVSALSLTDDLYQSLRSASGKELLGKGIALFVGSASPKLPPSSNARSRKIHRSERRTRVTSISASPTPKKARCRARSSL